jgi:hypothetical protein
VLRVRVGWQLVVDVIILNRVDKVLNEDTVDRVPREVVQGVVLREDFCLGLRVVGVACTSHQLANLIDKV